MTLQEQLTQLDKQRSELIKQIEASKDDWKHPKGWVLGKSTLILLRPQGKDMDVILQKLYLFSRMQQWVDFHCPDWKPDWNNGFENKFGIAMFCNNAGVTCYALQNGFVFGLSVPTQEMAEAMLKEFKTEIEKYY